MGMFDNVICGYSLPGNPPPWVVGHTFQTKDLGSTHDHHDYAGWLSYMASH